MFFSTKHPEFCSSFLSFSERYHTIQKIFQTYLGKIQVYQKFKIFDMGMIIYVNGKERFVVTEVERSIDISNLESGVYFLIIVDNLGNPYRSKFIVER